MTLGTGYKTTAASHPLESLKHFTTDLSLMPMPDWLGTSEAVDLGPYIMGTGIYMSYETCESIPSYKWVCAGACIPLYTVLMSNIKLPI